MSHGPSFAEESYFKTLNTELTRRLKLGLEGQKSKEGEASANGEIHSQEITGQHAALRFRR
jgi:hypothetical protein